MDTRRSDKQDDKVVSVDDKQVNVPRVHVDVSPPPVSTPAHVSPMDVIKDCVDTIHKKSVELPSSDELAQILLCTQQLVDAMHAYTQADVDKQAVQAELAMDDTPVVKDA